MGKGIFLVLLSGFLMLGLSSAFAEEPGLTDQAILKAWGQVQTDVQQISEPVTLERNDGPQMLTDKDLDKVNAAGMRRFGFAVITNQYNTFAAIANTGNCTALIGICKQPRMIKVK